jgi:hypothetical protein
MVTAMDARCCKASQGAKWCCKVSQNLQKLSLPDCGSDAAGLKCILDALQESNAALMVLNLSGIGEELEEKGGQMISDFLLSKCHTSLSLQELIFGRELFTGQRCN